MLNNRSIGNIGELHARDFLKNNGFKILECNFRFSRFGEIDIIAMDGEYLCFVEVKSRSSNNYGTPAEAVTPKKQLYIKNLASIYLKKHNLFDSKVRFDIIEVIFSKNYDTIKIKSIGIIKDAF